MLFLRAPFVSFVLTVMLLGLFYADELSQPNGYYLPDSGPGLKNYYTLTYHQQYDSSFSHFGGMAYPYGDHTAYSEGQPSLALILWIIPSLRPWTIGIMNLLLILGVGLCAWILCKLFIRLGMTRGSSLFAASAIALFSPQLASLNTNFALAYCFVIPWILYVAMIYADKPSFKRGLWVFLAILVVSGLHFFYFLMAALFVAFLYLSEALRRKKMPLWKYGLGYLLQVLLPFGLYLVWIKTTDDIIDRPGFLYGLREYHTPWQGMFLPPYEFLNTGLVNQETTAYAGLPAVVYFVYFLISRVKLLFEKSSSLKFLKSHSFLIAGALLFLLPSVLPFTGIGPLGWVFYYCLNIFLFLQLAGRRKRLGMILGSLAILILFLEGLYFHANFSQEIGQKRGDQIDRAQLVSHTDHILFPLPYFHTGSENIETRPSENYLAEQTMALSLASGMPTFGSMMSRSSLSQTLALFEMALNLSGPLMDNQRPWLIIRAPSYSNRVTRILPGRTGGVADTLSIYAMKPKVLLSLKEKSKPESPGELPLNLLFYNDFSYNNGRGLGQGHGLSLDQSQETVLYEGPGFPDTVSFFLWLEAQHDGFRHYHLSIRNMENGDEWVHSPAVLIDNVVDGFARIRLRNQDWNFPCRISIRYDGPFEQKVGVDECVIIKENQGFSYTQNSWVFTDEFVFKPGR